MMSYFPILAGSFLFVLGTILPIVNPPAVAPIFWSLTSGANAQTRKILAKRVAINACIMIVTALFLGNYVLSMFGISLSVVRVGGGVLVMAAAWKLLNAEDPDTTHHKIDADSYSLDRVRNSAFYPLTFPITCGPGTIAAAITVGASLHEPSFSVPTILAILGTLSGVLVIALTVYLCCRFAAQFLHKLGNSGTVIFMRLSAFILLCIGVQILWAGVHDLVLSLYADALKLKP